ncbi:TusE/DsrC/DsvC family sulfur relay protein [Thiobacillus sedimenti]|uniref:TusE/DsrC/DsvC family sulfur relay protein n=2 Tax=Thiobacillus TaxID=919 RepID=A0ABZ1CIV3_9PROT|nr:TusE/DsrC/DsvC family sulfur relay protein [Thiobacillus sp. SCUT-2]WRS39124.1 TusE/DsrC/DsvC family sulfur relay protein [Thiobacillus sp. SCUT-2]
MERNINGKIVETDPEGYLVNLEDWSEELAVELAKEDNLELGENHWKIIHYMRDQFAQNGTAPNLRFLQKGLKEEFGDEWGDKKFLFDLFPFGPAKQAGRYAGTPKPTGCV